MNITPWKLIQTIFMVGIPYQHFIFIDLYGFCPWLGVNIGLMFIFICIYGIFFFSVLNPLVFLAWIIIPITFLVYHVSWLLFIGLLIYYILFWLIKGWYTRFWSILIVWFLILILYMIKTCISNLAIMLTIHMPI